MKKLIFVLLLISGSAHAVVMEGRFDGFITSGTDGTGYFGTGATNLSGLAISGRITIDTDAAPADFQAGDPHLGAYLTNSGSAWLNMTVTVNGVSATVTGNTYQSFTINKSPISGPFGLQHYMSATTYEESTVAVAPNVDQVKAWDGYVTFHEYTTPTIPSDQLGFPFSWQDNDATDYGYGHFRLYDYFLNSSTLEYTTINYAQLNFDILNFELVEVPEPVTSVLFILSLILLVAARKRYLTKQ